MSNNENTDNNAVGLFLKAMVSREPGKRKVKPSKTALIDLAELDFGESSDDSDFQVDESKLNEDDDISLNSGSDDNKDSEGESESDDVEDSANIQKGSRTDELLRQAEELSILNALSVTDKPKVLVCAVCLGDYSDDNNEIVICDSCHVSVHEGCYGISDTISVSSTVSSSSTEPWFCDSCKAGIQYPSCELCPNLGHGIFKETETGSWVHLVCALYIPGIAFSEVDKLSFPTLFEMSFARYGAKTCNLCEDQRFARTGVCIGCDAGMCRSNFHVTCAQREGLLSEVNHGEADQADPYYAHCRLHTDKELIRKRKRNWLALQMVRKYEEQKATDHSRANDRLLFKLEKYKERYSLTKAERGRPWLPTQKMPRSASTSASLFRSLLRKTKLMGLETESQAAMTPQLEDIRKKWHLPPAFSLEFISYYLDRNVREQEMKLQLEKHLEDNQKLVEEETRLMAEYSAAKEENKKLEEDTKSLLNEALDLHNLLKGLACRPLCLPPIVATLHDKYVNGNNIQPAVQDVRPTTEKTLRTKAATKMMTSNIDVSFGENGPKKLKPNEAIALNQCGVCETCKDQHHLIQCDMCRNFYHLSCLDPPLSRMPKKTKQMGWQCSDCCKSSDSDKTSEIDTAAPRKLRRNIKEPTKFSPELEQKVQEEKSPEPAPPALPNESENNIKPAIKTPTKSIKKRGKKKIRGPRLTATATCIIPETPPVSEVPKKDLGSPRGRPRKKSTESPRKPRSYLKMKDIQDTKPKRKQSETEPKEEPVFKPEVKDTDKLNGAKTDDPLATPSSKETVEAEQPTLNDTPKEAVASESAKASISSISNITELSADSLSSECQSEDAARKEKRHRDRKEKKRIRGEKNDDCVKKRKKHHHHHKDKLAEMSSEILSPVRLKIKPLPPRPTETTATTRPLEVHTPSTSTNTAPPGYPPLPPGYTLTHPMQLGAEPEISARNEKAFQLPYITVATGPNVTTAVISNAKKNGSKKKSDGGSEQFSKCDVCGEMGGVTNTVACDECLKAYHFNCLEPPLKKSPKRRGYSWFCEDCDNGIKQPDK